MGWAPVSYRSALRSTVPEGIGTAGEASGPGVSSGSSLPGGGAENACPISLSVGPFDDLLSSTGTPVQQFVEGRKPIRTIRSRQRIGLKLMRHARVVCRGLIALCLVTVTIGFVDVQASDGFDKKGEIEGVVEAVDVQNDQLTVRGTVYIVTKQTEYEGIEDLSGLSPGTRIEIEYEETLNGREALEIETEGADDEEGDQDEDEREEEENEVTGMVEAVGDRVLTIDGIDYAVSGRTEYEGISGLSDLSSGDEVEIEYEERNNGREALEVELAVAADDD